MRGDCYEPDNIGFLVIFTIMEPDRNGQAPIQRITIKLGFVLTACSLRQPI